MPSDFAFRLSTYIALALSCLCLGFAEWDWLPLATIFSGLVIVALVVSFVMEGRAELSLARANALGLGIGILVVLWLAWQFSRPASGPIAQLTWPTNLLPFMGPVLMILIPAKLFRPKHVGDWWTMHGIGMAGVALASSLDDQPIFGVMMGLYALAEVVALVLFFYRRAGGFIPGIPNQAPVIRAQLVIDERKTPTSVPKLVWHSVLWLVVAAAVALPAFLMTPRSGMPQWSLGQTRLETGISGEQTIDLNRTGELKNSGEVAFMATARNGDGTPKDDIPGDQLWRAAAYQIYDEGKWKIDRYNMRSSSSFLPQEEQGFAVFQRENVSYVDILPMENLKVRPLLSPLRWIPRLPIPVATFRDVPGRGWYVVQWSTHTDGGFAPPPEPRLTGEWFYRQAIPTSDEPMLGTGFEKTAATRGTTILLANEMGLKGNRNARIGNWARSVFQKLIQERKLDPAIAERANKFLEPQVDRADWEAVAKAFNEYFSLSGEFRYSTKLNRVDKKLDPIEDFLVNLREGHCERYAAALALSLRSLGIPTQFVMGYKGHEFQGEGQYLVRQDHAHAWVEVLIPRPMPENFPKNPNHPEGDILWHWLTLDPTPIDASITEPTAKSWFATAREFGKEFFENYIVGYNPERRKRTYDQVREIAQDYGALLLLIPAGWFTRRAWKRSLQKRRNASQSPDQANEIPGWYTRYLSILDQHGFAMPTQATPREHAEAVGMTLKVISHPEIGELPMYIVSKLYRQRFAGLPIQDSELTEINAALARLQEALRQLPTRKKS